MDPRFSARHSRASPEDDPHGSGVAYNKFSTKLMTMLGYIYFNGINT